MWPSPGQGSVCLTKLYACWCSGSTLIDFYHQALCTTVILEIIFCPLCPQTGKFPLIMRILVLRVLNMYLLNLHCTRDALCSTHWGVVMNDQEHRFAVTQTWAHAPVHLLIATSSQMIHIAALSLRLCICKGGSR